MKIKFYKVVIFSENPLTAHFKFENKFQIYPFESPNAPYSDRVKLHPIALEYWVDEDVDIETPEALKRVESTYKHIATSMPPQKKILSLLTALTNYRFYFPTIQWQWFVEIPIGKLDESINDQKSVSGINWYWYKELHKECQIEKLTEVQNPAIEIKPHPEYFSNISLDENETMAFPEYISTALHNYYALPPEKRSVVDAAASLISNGITLRNSMNSLSFVSFVSSIETLVDFEFKNEKVKRCDACGTTQYRVMGKVREFIAKYVSILPATKKQIDEIYGVRSKIVHSGELLLSDDIFDWGNYERRTEQWNIHLSTLQLSRVALTNWLLELAKNQNVQNA